VLGNVQAESHFLYSPATNRILPLHSRIADGHLVIGDCDSVELADRYGTPLYVYDEAELEDECVSFARAIGVGPDGSRGLYALKAFPSMAMAGLAFRAGLGILCASGGEVAVAEAAGVPAEHRVLHGNNKSDRELGSAVGRIVVDSFDEIERLASIGLDVDAWLRVAPGLDAGGHEFIRTGGVDTKFGIGLNQAVEASKRLASLPNVRLAGLHAHMGSQVFGAEQWIELAQLMMPLAQEVAEATGSTIRELDLGGGFGIAYTQDDPPAAAPGEVAARILEHWPADLALVMEPGRALVGRAGVSLHRIGTVKEIPGVRTYVAVDGGMSDNIRPALYGARYEFLLANRTDAPIEQSVRLVGKHCETGDILAHEARLPANPRPGDLVATLATGAYAWAMSSNYNQLPRPAVVFCREGRSRVVVRRETTDDLIRLHAP